MFAFYIESNFKFHTRQPISLFFRSVQKNQSTKDQPHHPTDSICSLAIVGTAWTDRTDLRRKGLPCWQIREQRERRRTNGALKTCDQARYTYR